jgi:hypothetical protein
MLVDIISFTDVELFYLFYHTNIGYFFPVAMVHIQKEWRKAPTDLPIISKARWTTFMGIIPTFNLYFLTSSSRRCWKL